MSVEVYSAKIEPLYTASQAMTGMWKKDPCNFTDRDRHSTCCRFDSVTDRDKYGQGGRLRLERLQCVSDFIPVRIALKTFFIGEARWEHCVLALILR